MPAATAGDDRGGGRGRAQYRDAAAVHRQGERVLKEGPPYGRQPTLKVLEAILLSQECNAPVLQVMEAARGRFDIVPVMVGSLSTSSEAKYGKIFAKYLEVS